jgi:hypothetical protein
MRPIPLIKRLREMTPVKEAFERDEGIAIALR